jgi:hypothetical protein
MGMKSHDTTAIPLCRQCHRDYHDHRGHFKTMNRAQKLAWHDEKLARVIERVMEENAQDEDDYELSRSAEWDEVF